MASKSKNSLSLLDTFSNLTFEMKGSLSNIDSPLLLGLATLFIAEEKEIRDYMSAEEIVACLERAGVAIKKTQLLGAFAKAGDMISRQILDEEIHYKIMTKGKSKVIPLLEKGTLQVSYVEAGQPRTVRKMLYDMLSEIKGEVRICDPFYGVRSLDILEMFSKTCKVMFLTEKASEPRIALSNAISDFKREYSNVEIRIYQIPRVLHDRFIITQDFILLLGHGIKDIGNKESFVVSLDKSYAKELIDSMTANFDSKWREGVVL